MTAASVAFKEIVPPCPTLPSPVVTTDELLLRVNTADDCGSSNGILRLEFLWTSCFASGCTFFLAANRTRVEPVATRSTERKSCSLSSALTASWHLLSNPTGPSYRSVIAAYATAESLLLGRMESAIKCVHNSTRSLTMETLKVGIREFREKLASYLLETDVPVAITRHGDTIGYYIPARRKRTEAERTALKEVAARLQQVLAAEGISEEEILKDFKQWRAGGRK
jgi:PHD/YefM family antitoxin component YafN of YafNO toxin-antitoxin module